MEQEINISNLTILLVMAVIIIDRVLGMLKSRGIDLQLMSRQLCELHDWHNVTDAEGVKVWYIRRSLEEAISRLADAIEVQSRVLDKMDRKMERVEDRVTSPQYIVGKK